MTPGKIAIILKCKMCMYSQHFQQSIDQPGFVAKPARGQLDRENDEPLSPFAPETLLSRDGFGRPVPRQSAQSHLVLFRDSPCFSRRRPYNIPPTATGSVPSLSGHVIAYR